MNADGAFRMDVRAVEGMQGSVPWLGTRRTGRKTKKIFAYGIALVMGTKRRIDD